MSSITGVSGSWGGALPLVQHSGLERCGQAVARQLPEVVHRTSAPPEARRVPDSSRHIVLGPRHRIVERVAEGEVRGDGGSKRAAGAVGVAAWDSGAAKSLEGALPVQ